MIIIKDELKKIIYNDLYRYEGKSSSILKYYKNLITNRSFKYTVLIRKAKYYKNRNRIKFYIYRILMRIYSSKTGFQIPYNVQIGEGFQINHWGRVIVNEDVIMGKNVSISTGVLIGKEFRGKRKGAPIIENEVYIGANSTIVGKINIGSNVLIAPNTYVNKDIPSNSIVLGNPAVIIENKLNATDGYVYNKVSREM